MLYEYPLGKNPLYFPCNGTILVNSMKKVELHADSSGIQAVQE